MISTLKNCTNFGSRLKTITKTTSLCGGIHLFVNSKRTYYFKDIYLHPGPGYIDLDDGGEKPDGVPDTWTTMDIGSYSSPICDFGHFDEDTFPPALEGETLEQYCRRVPNIWSPCSNADDVVDMKVFMQIEFAREGPIEQIHDIEMPLIKIPPESADWHVTYVPDYDLMLKEMLFRNRPFPIKVTDDEYDAMLREFQRGIEERGIGYHFKSRVFHDFWLELTGRDVKEIADIPTWEEEIDRRIELAKDRNRRYWLEQSEEMLEDLVDKQPEPAKVES
jgi:hypothetical protein